MKANINKNILEIGDRLIVNIGVYSENGIIKKLSRENLPMVLGQNNFIPDFDSNLIGQNLEEFYEFVKTFNKRYPHPMFRNNRFKFVVEVLEYHDKQFGELVKKNMELTGQLAKMEKQKSEQNAKADPKELKEKDELIEQLRENIAQLKQEVFDAKRAPKALVIPPEMKKEAEKYALQKFFDKFISIYIYYKITTLRSQMEAEVLQDDKLLAYAKGFRMITYQFDQLFQSYGIQEITPVEGEIFDPSYQKVNEQFIDDKLPSNTIINVHSPCFKLHDRTINVAIVDTTVQSSDEKLAKKVIEKMGPRAHHKTPGVLHTMEQKVRSSIEKHLNVSEETSEDGKEIKATLDVKAEPAKAKKTTKKKAETSVKQTEKETKPKKESAAKKKISVKVKK